MASYREMWLISRTYIGNPYSEGLGDGEGPPWLSQLARWHSAMTQYVVQAQLQQVTYIWQAFSCIWFEQKYFTRRSLWYYHGVMEPREIHYRHRLLDWHIHEERGEVTDFTMVPYTYHNTKLLTHWLHTSHGKAARTGFERDLIALRTRITVSVPDIDHQYQLSMDAFLWSPLRLFLDMYLNRVVYR